MKAYLGLFVAAVSLGASGVKGFDYEISDPGTIFLTDSASGIMDLQSIFIDEPVNVSVVDIMWEPNENITDDNTIIWDTFVDGVLSASGTYSLADVGRELPTSIPTGTVTVGQRGTSTIAVTLMLDEVKSETSRSFQVYAAGVSLIPLIVVLCFAMTTHMVEFSLFSGIFVGACIVYGNIKDGFKRTLDKYLVDALTDPGHVYVVLFTLFLSGLVGMMAKSGGMIGFTRDVGKIARTPRSGQAACYLVGLFIFFDDYANTLLAGQSMRPLLDTLFISREKLAFIVDATSAPVASLSPISSWVGFEVGLIQTEIDKIIAITGTDDIGIKTSGFGVFLQSIKYRYYPIFMLTFIVIIIWADRDWGPMLARERKARVYRITDGGEGKGRAEELSKGQNEPEEDTPKKSWNMTVPVLLLICLIFYLLVETGTIPGTSQTFMDKIENSDSYSALLWGTMGTTLCTLIMYLLQPVKDGRLTLPKWAIMKELFGGFCRKNLEAQKAKKPYKKSVDDEVDEEEKEDEEEEEEEEEKASSKPARFLMSVFETVESFLFGMGRIFPALIVLTLAWASGTMMTAVGADRLFSSWIIGGLDPRMLPTLSFIVALFMALATGTSWGTMTILFPLLLVPTYFASEGDELIFYATVAGVLSGSVAGDHMSPISDTTVLSALACDCDLVAHVVTQAPYAILMSILAVLCGTLPIGYEAWPNMIGILIGWGLSVCFVFFLGQKLINKTGTFGPIFELYLKYGKKGQSELEQLRIDTQKAYADNPDEYKLCDFLFWRKKDKLEEDEKTPFDEADEEMPKGTLAEEAVVSKDVADDTFEETKEEEVIETGVPKTDVGDSLTASVRC